MKNMEKGELEEKLEAFIKKIKLMKEEEKMDLSADEDLSIAIMNLVSIEEHLFFTGAKTEKTKYYDLIDEVRKIRKELLKRIVGEYEGEVWCISKHLLAASYRLMEVGTKLLSQGKSEEAYSFFEKAYSLYAIFWGINLKILDIGEVKKIKDQALNKHDKENTLEKLSEKETENDQDGNEKSGSALKRLGYLVKKAIDCCRE